MKKILMILGLGFMLGGCTATSIEGKILRLGHEPFSYLAVQDINSKSFYKIINNSEYEQYQGQIKNLKIKMIKQSDTRLIPSEIEILSIK